MARGAMSKTTPARNPTIKRIIFRDYSARVGVVKSGCKPSPLGA
jgi:hypothetical protein